MNTDILAEYFGGVLVPLNDYKKDLTALPNGTIVRVLVKTEDAVSRCSKEHRKYWVMLKKISELLTGGSDKVTKENLHSELLDEFCKTKLGTQEESLYWKDYNVYVGGEIKAAKIHIGENYRDMNRSMFEEYVRFVLNFLIKNYKMDGELIVKFNFNTAVREGDAVGV